MNPLLDTFAAMKHHTLVLDAARDEGPYYHLLNCFRMVVIAGAYWRAAREPRRRGRRQG